MIKIYGSMLCKDCVKCLQDLDQAGVAYEYLDFAEELQNLKDFLKIRDASALFDNARKKWRNWNTLHTKRRWQHDLGLAGVYVIGA